LVRRLDDIASSQRLFGPPALGFDRSNFAVATKCVRLSILAEPKSPGRSRLILERGENALCKQETANAQPSTSNVQRLIRVAIVVSLWVLFGRLKACRENSDEFFVLDQKWALQIRATDLQNRMVASSSDHRTLSFSRTPSHSMLSVER
jgi:hypothetical protein